MPWKETCCMDERMKFVAAWLEGEESRAALCRRFGDQSEDGLQVVGTVCCRSVDWIVRPFARAAVVCRTGYRVSLPCRSWKYGMRIRAGVRASCGRY